MHSRVREWVVYALLGTVMFVAKMALASLPNIEPVSLFVIVYTLTFGKKALTPIYIYVALELLTWGPGIWNICYLYVWLVLYLLTKLFHRMESVWGWAILSAGYGLAFGALCALVYIVIGGWSFALSWWISGIPFDVIHCVGNFTITLLLLRPLRNTLQVLQQKYLQL